MAWPSRNNSDEVMAVWSQIGSVVLAFNMQDHLADPEFIERFFDDPDPKDFISLLLNRIS